jgi:hypothetical protein
MTPETLFAFLILLQFMVIVCHDWLDIPGWTHGCQVQEVIGRTKLLWATAINALFPGTAVMLAVWFWGRPHPRFVGTYWVVYCALTVISAIGMWYVPYLFGADEKKKLVYLRMYEGTRHILPPRGDNPRPNLLHICFHILFLVTFSLALLIRLRPT